MTSLFLGRGDFMDNFDLTKDSRLPQELVILAFNPNQFLHLPQSGNMEL